MVVTEMQGNLDINSMKKNMLTRSSGGGGQRKVEFRVPILNMEDKFKDFPKDFFQVNSGRRFYYGSR